jgi:hypothetical protein
LAAGTLTANALAKWEEADQCQIVCLSRCKTATKS